MTRAETRVSWGRMRRSEAVLGIALLLAGASAPPADAEEQIVAEKLALCATCHTETGNSVVPQHPKLASLGREYLENQLNDFKRGVRKNDVMAGIAAQLTNTEIEALAAHYARQKPTQGGTADPNLAAAGKSIFDEGIEATAVPACAGCHEEDGRGDGKFPRLAGQHPAYAIDQLLKFKRGERSNDRKSVMRAVAKRMNEEQIRAVAEYMATLSGGVQ